MTLPLSHIQSRARYVCASCHDEGSHDTITELPSGWTLYAGMHLCQSCTPYSRALRESSEKAIGVALIERARIVAWLRLKQMEWQPHHPLNTIGEAADAIARGEHEKEIP